MIGKIFLLIGQNPSKARCRLTSAAYFKYSWGSGRGPILGKFSKTYSHLILKPVFVGLTLKKNCYINMNISFSRKLAVLLKTGFTSLSYKHTVPERLPSQFYKIWINGDLKNPSFSNSLLNGEKLETKTGLILKKAISFYLFHQ